MASSIQQFFKDHGISDVEAIIPDMAGVARGKIMPAEKFAEDEGMRLPEGIFLQTVTGEYPEDDSAISPSEIDIVLKADPRTVRVVPWAAEPTAQVIHDCFYSDGRPVTMAPRYVLRHVLELYAQRGWEPVVAPELEFYLVEPNIDSDYPLKPPVGRSGRPEIGRQSYSIAAVNEFDPLFDDIYAFCEAQDIEIDTLIHEDGAAQMEINLLHGNALDSRRPGVPVQAHGARGGIAPQDVRDLHGQAHGARAGQRHAHPPEHRRPQEQAEHLQQSGRHAEPAVLLAHRGPAEVPAGGDVAVRAQRQFLPPHHALPLGADQRAVGLRQPHRRPARADVLARPHAASRIASAARMPTPTSRSPPRWPAATWA